MRALLADPSHAVSFGVNRPCYWAIRHAGSLIAAMQGLDAVAFTGGIGENAAPVRARIMDGLAWLGAQIDARANATGETRLHAPSSGIACWIIPAQEERMIAGGAQRLLSR